MNRRKFLATAGLLTASSALGMDMRRMVASVLSQPRRATVDAFQAYIQSKQTGEVICGGVPPTAYADTTALSGGVAGTTYLSLGTSMRVRQNGVLTKIKARVTSSGSQQIKFKVFRPNGSNYDFVSETELLNFTVGAAHNQDFTFTTPLNVLIGDCIGFYITGAASNNGFVWSSGTGSFGTVSGDVTSSNAFSSTTANRLNITAYTIKPYIVITGDSIAEGSSDPLPSVSYRSLWSTGPLNSNLDREPGSVLRGKISGDVLLHQNHGLGSQQMSWVSETAVPYIINYNLPYVLFIHCGVNDVNAGRTNAQVLANLDTIKAALTAASFTGKLVIDSVLPWTNASDAQAAAVRSLNTAYSGWCAANSAYFCDSHDTLGKLRASTGFLDDLQDAYQLDDGLKVHLTAAGVSAWMGYVNTFLRTIL